MIKSWRTFLFPCCFFGGNAGAWDWYSRSVCYTSHWLLSNWIGMTSSIVIVEFYLVSCQLWTSKLILFLWNQSSTCNAWKTPDAVEIWIRLRTLDFCFMKVILSEDHRTCFCISTPSSVFIESSYWDSTKDMVLACSMKKKFFFYNINTWTDTVLLFRFTLVCGIRFLFCPFV